MVTQVRRQDGFSIIGWYWSGRHIHAVCFSGFSAMLDLYMGGCQAAPGKISDQLCKQQKCAV